MEVLAFSLTIIRSMLQRPLIRKQKPEDEKIFFQMIVKKLLKWELGLRNSSARESDLIEFLGGILNEEIISSSTSYYTNTN